MRIVCAVFLLSIFLQLSESVIRDDCECGRANPANIRIVNGFEVHPNKYPWMAVMLSSLGNQICGGSIISDRTILTAGHCMFYTQNQLQTKWMVAAHSVKQSKARSGSNNIYKTITYEFHPNFKNSPIFDDFDMSVVTVDRPIRFDMNVKPICLPYPGEHKIYYNKKVLVTGWGKLSDNRNAPVSDVLMETKVFLKTPATCRAMTELAGYNDRSMVCAYDYNTDACLGDSGGPLFAETTPNRYIILGVVSFGEGCATDFPGIYAKVDEEPTLNWMHEATERASGNFCRDSIENRRFLGRVWDWITGKKPEEEEAGKKDEKKNEEMTPEPETDNGNNEVVPETDGENVTELPIEENGNEIPENGGEEEEKESKPDIDVENSNQKEIYPPKNVIPLNNQDQFEDENNYSQEEQIDDQEIANYQYS